MAAWVIRFARPRRRNGRRVQTARLKTGDEIRLGTAKLAYRVDYSSPVQ